MSQIVGGPAQAAQKGARQAEQERLIAEAQQSPEVGRFLAAYEAIRVHLPAAPVQSPPQVNFATGGNG